VAILINKNKVIIPITAIAGRSAGRIVVGGRVRQRCICTAVPPRSWIGIQSRPLQTTDIFVTSQALLLRWLFVTFCLYAIGAFCSERTEKELHKSWCRKARKGTTISPEASVRLPN
jgi:hypothetical protein